MKSKKELNLNDLRKLKKQIPISISFAKKLLEKYEGNIELVIQNFKENQIEILTKNLNIESTIAEKYLNENNFEINKAIKNYEKEHFTKTELILRRKISNSDKVSLICSVVEIKYDLKRDYWLKKEKIEKLDLKIQNILSVNEAIEYEEWETFSSALYLLKQQIERIRNIFHCEELANFLENAKESTDDNFFQNEKEKLYENMLNYVSKNKEDFP
ncbi:hypothetical protein [Aureivirga sp. CE67]|uniref:hypothetical protein n=1 Tax=Aureivirga sp. CE67 TaxID=1788983 RepID=UPI0018C9D48C|nr:hypothetical protein [Aureivirga sp. CE67]